MIFDNKSDAHVAKIRDFKSHVAHGSIKKKKLSKKLEVKLYARVAHKINIPKQKITSGELDS